jgi:hypothetical protein
VHKFRRIPGADIHPHSHAGRLVKIVVASLLVLVAAWLGWAGFQLFLASVV